MNKLYLKICELINKSIPGFSIIIFSFFTICVMFFYGFVPGEAEAHAWTIAGNVNIFQLIDLMNAEGHFLLWYLCLMPFAKFPSLYPWSMYLINWGFCLFALYILWEKAPFSNITKMCITFSAPFFKIYSIYPRCYAIGIMFLFMAMALYKDRLNKPYKYLACLTLAANTSAPVCIGAGVLGLMFVYDLVVQKCDKKILYISLGTALCCLILFYFQFHSVSTPDYEGTKLLTLQNRSPQILAFLGFKAYSNSVIFAKLILSWLAAITIPILFWKNKRAFVFFITTEISLMLFFLYIYGARPYHMFFFFVFAIIGFWIFKTENYQTRTKISEFVLFLISLSMVFTSVHVPNNILEPLYPVITSDNTLKSGKIYTNYGPIYVSVALPYLAKEGLTIYNMQGDDLNSYKVLRNYFDKNKKFMEPDSFAEHLDSTKRNFIILDGTFKYSYIEGKKYKFNVTLYKTDLMRGLENPINIYEVTNVRKL